MTIRSGRPLVSVVVPMLNEFAYIQSCLDSFSHQTYGCDRLDLMVVDGGSTDGSRELVQAYAIAHPWCRLIDNPRRKASAAFNLGIDHAEGEVLVLFSAHGEPAADFIERAVAVLIETGTAGVGGRYHHEGTDPVSRAIGLAMVSPVGMASPHRSMDERGLVDTISHPAYDLELLRSVGHFDEKLERNSDYELNWRMREAGHELLFDPSVESTYRPRPSLRALARQFWWYGRWKERVVRRHPRSLRARHLMPPMLVAALASTPVLARWATGRRAVALGAAAYAAVVIEGTRRAHPSRKGASIPALVACFPTMHLAWGAGFLMSLVEDTIESVSGGGDGDG